MRKWGLAVAVGFIFFVSPVQSAEIAPLESLVRLSAEVVSETAVPGQLFEIRVTAEVPGGWHINARKPTIDYLIPTELTFDVPRGVTVTDVEYPAPVRKTFSFAESPLDLYEGRIIFRAHLQSADIAPGEYTLKGRLRYQACDNEKCLPPEEARTEIPLRIIQTVHQTPHPGLPPSHGDSLRSQGGKGSNLIEKLFKERGSFLALMFIFWAGALLNLTPCVYPMIPVTVAYFGGRSASGAAGRPVFGAIAYYLGIILTFSILGTVAGLTGGLFGAALQSPVVLVGLALLMIYLAAGMFGWVPFQLPDRLVQRMGGGRAPLGTFGMGATMGVVAAPCIGPFVVGLLAYVGSRKSALVGFSLFSVMAAGLGLPYLFLGLFSGQIRNLPKSGAWMDGVKWIFGLVLIGMAGYFISPLIPSSRPGESFWLPYDRVSFESARASGRPVILDFSAEWCLPCKKLERTTYQDKRFRAALENAVRLKVDLTLYDAPESVSARREFNVSGVPTVIYFDASGVERFRFLGEFTPEEFLGELAKLNP